MNYKLKVKAILIGIATIVISSILIGLGMAITALFYPQFVDSLQKTNNRYCFFLLTGMIPCIFGGLVTGSIVKEDRIKNAFALAVLSLILRESAALLFEHGSFLYRAEGEVTGFLSTILGGYLAKLAFERKHNRDKHG